MDTTYNRITVELKFLNQGVAAKESVAYNRITVELKLTKRMWNKAKVKLIIVSQWN